MQLALRLGRTLDELGASMSSAEFSLWAALYQEDQWGEARDDWRAGMVAATVANYAGKVRRDGEALGPEDFFPALAAPKADAEPDPVAFFSAVAAANNRKPKE